MKKVILQYFENLKLAIGEKISNDINEEKLTAIVNDDLGFHLTDKASSDFQQFYFKSINNSYFYFHSNDFFNRFKYNYSLQGISNQYLQFLEENKKEIFDLIKKDKLPELYFKYFAKAKIEQKNGVVTKNLGSFFAKLVHTFQPNKYCALDNPIKNYFDLKNESFFVAFLIISESYLQWIKNHKSLINEIRENMQKIDSNHIFDFEKLTDLKILDLIFWKKANI